MVIIQKSWWGLILAFRLQQQLICLFVCFFFVVGIINIEMLKIKKRKFNPKCINEHVFSTGLRSRFATPLLGLLSCRSSSHLRSFSWHWAQLSLALLTRADFLIIIECTGASRGVPLARPNPTQSHVFSFSRRQHPQVRWAEREAPRRAGESGQVGRRGHRRLRRCKVESDCLVARRRRGISACDMRLRWQVLIYIEADVDVRRPEGSSPSHTLPSLSEGDNGAEPGSTRDFQGDNKGPTIKFYTLCVTMYD